MKKNLITKRVEFSASHRYWNPKWSEKKNKEIFGKNVFEHGHNFVLDVTVEGEVNKLTGMIINLFDLKSIVNSVISQFDHKYLNKDVDYFKNVIPTPENIAKRLWDLIDDEINNREDICTLYNIRIYETPNLYIDYRR